MPTTQSDTLNRAAVEALMLGLGIDGYAELGRRAAIDRTNISRIMRGERPARPSHIVAIARGLKVPVAAISGTLTAEDEAIIRQQVEALG